MEVGGNDIKKVRKKISNFFLDMLFLCYIIYIQMEKGKVGSILLENISNNLVE